MRNIRLLGLAIGLTLAAAAGTAAQIQPTAAKTAEMRQKGPCNDPWISWAYIDASAGTAEAAGFGSYGQCNPAWYNNGTWNNYTELYNAVREYRNSLYRAGISYTTKTQSNGTKVHFATIDGMMFGVIQQGNSLVGNDGASLISNQAGLISNASSDGHGGIVAAGAGNLQAPRVVPTAGGSYSLKAGEQKRIKVGPNTYLVIKKS